MRKNARILNFFNFMKFNVKYFNQATSTSGTVSSEVIKERPIDKWVELKNLKKCEYELIDLKNSIEERLNKASVQKSVVNYWELDNYHRNIVNINFRNTRNLEGIISMIKTFKGNLDTSQIFKKLDLLGDQKDLRREVFTVIIPLLKEYLVKSDRHTINDIYFAAIGASKLNIVDQEYWDIVEGKLINEKLFKYLSLEQCINLAHELKPKNRGSLFLMKLLENEFIKHRKAIHSKKIFIKLLKETYLNKAEVSEVLLAALEDPNIEIKKTEKLI